MEQLHLVTRCTRYSTICVHHATCTCVHCRGCEEQVLLSLLSRGYSRSTNDRRIDMSTGGKSLEWDLPHSLLQSTAASISSRISKYSTVDDLQISRFPTLPCVNLKVINRCLSSSSEMVSILSISAKHKITSTNKIEPSTMTIDRQGSTTPIPRYHCDVNHCRNHDLRLNYHVCCDPCSDDSAGNAQDLIQAQSGLRLEITGDLSVSSGPPNLSGDRI